MRNSVGLVFVLLLAICKRNLGDFDDDYAQGCSENTISQYCPSSCALEKEIFSYRKDIGSNVNQIKEKLREINMLFDDDDSEPRSDGKSHVTGQLMTTEQKTLKEAVKLLEENANAQRKAVTDVLTEIENQERTIHMMMRDIDELATECGDRCGQSGDQKTNDELNEGFPPIRQANCGDGVCGRAAFGVTVLGRSVENGHVCFKYGAPELKNCAELRERGYKKSGIYRIKPEETKPSFPVFCDMEDSGGGWIVIQRRVDGSLDFNRTWKEYENGFGNVSCSGEFWLGNKHLASIGLTGYQRSRIIMTDWEGETRVAQYSYFKVNQATHWYTLQISVFQEEESNVSDAMTSLLTQNNMRFTTTDQNHIYSILPANCPRLPGGWWFNKCNSANLNGHYHQGVFSPTSQPGGIIWITWKGPSYSLRSTEIKLRPFRYTGE